MIPSCSADREKEGTAQGGSETLRDGQEEMVTWVKNVLDRMNKVDGKVWLRGGKKRADFQSRSIVCKRVKGLQ